MNTYLDANANSLRFIDPLGLAYSPMGEHGMTWGEVLEGQALTVQNCIKCAATCVVHFLGGEALEEIVQKGVEHLAKKALDDLVFSVGKHVIARVLLVLTFIALAETVNCVIECEEQ